MIKINDSQANHREIGSLLIIVDNRAGGKINKENRESPAEIGRVAMSDVVVIKVNTSLSKRNTIDTEVPRTSKLITKTHNDFDNQILEKKI